MPMQFISNQRNIKELHDQQATKRWLNRCQHSAVQPKIVTLVPKGCWCNIPAISGTGRNIFMRFPLLGRVFVSYLRCAWHPWDRTEAKVAAPKPETHRIWLRIYRTMHDIIIRFSKPNPAFSVALSQRMCNVTVYDRSAGPEIVMAAMKSEVVLSQEWHKLESKFQQRFKCSRRCATDRRTGIGNGDWKREVV